MRFCHVTTFFGGASFGGDAAYVDRLSRALLNRGHEVDVVRCEASFQAVRGNVAPRAYVPPPGLKVHVLPAPGGPFSLLYSHQTGRMGLRKAPLQRLFDEGRYDVIHFHNVSLIGGTEVLSLRPTKGPTPVTLMTAHEYWLVCPLSLLWKSGAAPCDKPECLRCTLQAGRPPQFWRALDPGISSALAPLDALLFPSRHALDAHTGRGVTHPRMLQLPYFLPADWAGPAAAVPPSPRPYFAAAGRLIKEKGFHTLIPLMRHFPDADLRIAGAGRYESELRRQAAAVPNVSFTGPLEASALAGLYAGATAVIVPSLFHETFGLVTIEALSMGTPVIAHRAGALPEVLGDAAGGGVLYESDAALLDAMKRLLNDSSYRREAGESGRAAVSRHWSEAGHIDRYFDIIGQSGRGSASPGPAAPPRPAHTGE